jgi:hypothetical protein
MYKWIRIALFALPLAGGAAFAQGSGTSGSAGAPGSVNPPPVTSDTRTPMQEKAGRIDDTTPALPGDATKPVDVPNTVRDSNRNAMPDTTGMTTPGSQATDKKVHKRKGAEPKADESTLPRKSDVDHDTTSKTNDKLDRDQTRDQLDSDK